MYTKVMVLTVTYFRPFSHDQELLGCNLATMIVTKISQIQIARAIVSLQIFSQRSASATKYTYTLLKAEKTKSPTQTAGILLP